MKDKCESFDQKVRFSGLHLMLSPHGAASDAAVTTSLPEMLLIGTAGQTACAAVRRQATSSFKTLPLSCWLCCTDGSLYSLPLAALLPTLPVQVGVEIIQRAIRRPAKTIANNAGLEGDVIVGKLLEKVN